MKKIININFHSRVIPIEETAYEILQQYIQSLRRYFANEEGREEIISDIENRFAELFSESLKKGAACITDADVNAIIASMGRPEEFAEEDSASGTTGSASTGAGGAQGGYSQSSWQGDEPRRLYRADNDKILGGVCAGLANYLRLDPAIIRIIFVLITFGWGFGFLLYIILWMVLPYKSLPANARKRLYRNPDDRVIAGVASGLAAYFHIEVWIPRLIFCLPLIAGILTSILRHVWFYWGGPVFFTGGFGGTLFITYIVLWIVLPEATSASEKLEMRGEKVDLESIKNTIKSDLGNVNKKAREMGSEMKESFQKAGEQIRTSAQNFSAEAYPAMRRTGNGFGHAIGVLFKAFFLFIAGVIAFALIAALTALIFRGHGILHLKDYILYGFWENFLAWAGFFLFLVIPVIALLTWLIRRITGTRSRNHYLGYTFATLWVIGLFCLIALAGVFVSNFQARQHVEEEVSIAQPSHGKMIVKVDQSNRDRYDDTDWWSDWDFGNRGPLFVNEDSLMLNTVRLRLLRSDDSSFHVRSVKFSHGRDSHIARQTAEEISFPVRQADSVLYLPEGITINRHSQKFRNQQVIVEVYIPLGKRILVNRSIDHYHWFNINTHNRHIHWSSRDDDWDINWDNDNDDHESFSWDSDVEYTMTADGLRRTNWKNTPENERKDRNDGDDQPEYKSKDDNKSPNTDKGGYRYKGPERPRQKNNQDSPAVKSTAEAIEPRFTENPLSAFFYS